MAFPAIWMNGRLTDDARVSIFDHGFLYGDGVFEGIRFYGGHAFRLAAHLARLRRSAAAIELALPYEAGELARAVSAVIARSEAADGYIRMIVTRGEGDLGLDPRSCKHPTTIVAAAPLRVFPAASAGVAVVVASTRQAPADVVDARIKSLNYMNRLLARLEAVRAGADEALMLNVQGRLAEGTTDNVFVARGGVLYTPPPCDGALEGVTRQVVLEIARELGIPSEEASLGTYDLRAADEAFLVGTGAELVPIRSIDGRAMPASPGPLFRKIAALFDAVVRRETRSAQSSDFVES